MKFRTRAKTAYGLLSEIRKLILEEPKRYDQRAVLTIRGKRIDSLGYYETLPACGTVGCVAGWVTVLNASRPEKVYCPIDYAGKVLGLTTSQRYRLTFASAAGTDPSQTRQHAERGAEHIRQFQEDFASQLKRTKI